MLRLNGNELKWLVVSSILIENAKKNIYTNAKTGAEDSVVINGQIVINAKIESKNDDELVEKLNSIEEILKPGILNIDGIIYEVEVSQGLYQGMDFNNFNLCFSWNGMALINGEKRDLSE